LDEVVLRGLASQPEKRFPRVREFVAALANVQATSVVLKVVEEQPTSQSGSPMAFALEPKTRKGRSRVRMGAVAGAAAVLVFGAVGIALWKAPWKHKAQVSSGSLATGAPPAATAAPREQLPTMVPGLEAESGISVSVTVRATVDGAEAVVEGKRVLLPT